jgi:hypothetical protein
MSMYWCVNFLDDAKLRHGIKEKLWLMGYQYARDQSDPPSWRAAITRNWRKLDAIGIGNRFVAYLPGYKFYATGTVRTPRRPKTSQDPADTIENYLAERRAYQSGYVYFTSSVVYENFTDDFDGLPVRIDVERWENYVPDGVSVTGLNWTRNMTVNAVFEITKRHFDLIVRKLAAETGPPAQADNHGTRTLLAGAEQQLAERDDFDPSGIRDGRERTLASIVRRRGQPAFRKHLLSAYRGRCAITGCQVKAILEAAHIIPYKGSKTNHAGNGLLLRADLHTLFDLQLVAVNEATMRVLISPQLAGTEYEQYRGQRIRIPDDPASQPSREALKQHRQESGLRS